MLAHGTVNREAASTGDDEGEGNAQHQDEEFNAFTLLRAHPVHEEAVGEVDLHHGGAEHGADGDGGGADRSTRDQEERGKEFHEDHAKGEDPGDAHRAGEEAHGAFITVAAEPAEELLGAVGEDDGGKGQAEHGGGEGVVGAECGIEDRADHTVVGGVGTKHGRGSGGRIHLGYLIEDFRFLFQAVCLSGVSMAHRADSR